MSKSSSYVSTSEVVDNSSNNGLATTRGDGNVVQVLDAGAIQDALRFAGKAADGQAASVGDMLKTFGTVASNTLNNAYKSSQSALDFADGGTRKALDFAADNTDKSYDFAKLSLDAVNKNTNSSLARLSETSNGVNDAIMGAYTKAQNNGYNPQYIVFGVFALVAVILWRKK